MEPLKKCNSPKWNLITLGFFTLLSSLMLRFGDYGSMGMAVLLIVWIPLIIGTVTAILYGLSRFIGKRYNWIITVLGIVMMLIIAIPIFFGAAQHN